MSIGDTIRKYRKELKITQEQMANQLGVSAPAVNKWENGSSYPDISLLAPLARLLNIDINELLSFEEVLSDQEIITFINQLSENITTKGFEDSFQEAKNLIMRYPNSNKLKLWSAQIFNGYLVMKLQEVPDACKYEKQITSWVEQVAFCSDTELAKSAQMSLAQSFMKEKKYEEAQKLLDKIPPIGFDKRIAQVQLYTELEQFDNAFKELDGMLYRGANGLLSYLMQTITLLCKQKEYENALQYADLISQVSSIFDLGDYAGNGSYFTIYSEMKNKELALDSLEKMMAGIDTMRQPRSSNLYKHMKFSEDDGFDKMKMLLLKSFDNDPSFDLLRDEPRFQEIYHKYVR